MFGGLLVGEAILLPLTDEASGTVPAHPPDAATSPPRPAFVEAS